MPLQDAEPVRKGLNAPERPGTPELRETQAARSRPHWRRLAATHTGARKLQTCTFFSYTDTCRQATAAEPLVAASCRRSAAGCRRSAAAPTAPAAGTSQSGAAPAARETAKRPRNLSRSKGVIGVLPGTQSMAFHRDAPLIGRA